jgi:hypothetical protein
MYLLLHNRNMKVFMISRNTIKIYLWCKTLYFSAHCSDTKFITCFQSLINSRNKLFFHLFTSKSGAKRALWHAIIFYKDTNTISGYVNDLGVPHEIIPQSILLIFLHWISADRVLNILIIMLCTVTQNSL